MPSEQVGVCVVCRTGDRWRKDLHTGFSLGELKASSALSLGHVSGTNSG